MPRILTSLLFISATVFGLSANAQEEERIERLRGLSAAVGDQAQGLQTSMNQALNLITAYNEGTIDEGEIELTSLFDTIETNTQTILDSIALNSDFQDALDGMRAEIIVLIRRNEREPASARRDARLAALAELQERYDVSYNEILDMEGRLTQRLAQATDERRQVMLDQQVGDVRAIVEQLELVVGDLSALDQQLSQITATVWDNPDDVIAQE